MHLHVAVTTSMSEHIYDVSLCSMMLTCLAMHVLCSVIILVRFLELVYAGQSILLARLAIYIHMQYKVGLWMKCCRWNMDSNIHT